MDLISQKIERSELKEGDHIYTWRKQIYTHHGIYIGQDKLIQFVNPKKHVIRRLLVASSDYSTGKKEKTPCRIWYCGSEKVAGSGVRMTCIGCFVRDGALYRYKYQASRLFVACKIIVRGGTCTTAVSDPAKEVIHRATYLHENGYPDYNLIDNNCEDFSLYCKTSLWSKDIDHQGKSSQANRVHPTKVEDETKKLTKPINTDLGIRKDVVRVPVEELCSFLAALKLKSKTKKRTKPVNTDLGTFEDVVRVFVKDLSSFFASSS